MFLWLFYIAWFSYITVEIREIKLICIDSRPTILCVQVIFVGNLSCSIKAGFLPLAMSVI